jgi:DNA processing protein
VGSAVRSAGRADRAYPAGLRRLADPPQVLWWRGRLPDEAERRVAVVGARVIVPWGRWAARAVASSLAEGDVSIVSGLARGVDTVAHRVALEAGTRTYGVLGGGVDVPSPAANRSLAEAFVSAGGGLVAERPPGSVAHAKSLVARCRLQAALSEAVVVVQTDDASRTRFTAEAALRLGLPLAVVRPPRDLGALPAVRGNRDLLRRADLAIDGTSAESVHAGVLELLAALPVRS